MSLRRFSLVVTRYTSISIVNGRHVPTSDTTTSFNITASVQPLDGKTVATLPENIRENESYRIYTSTELFPTREDATPQLKADRVTLFNKLFEVIKVEKWQNSILPHFNCVVVKIDDKP